MVCVGLSERDLLQWHDVTRKILGGPGKILGGSGSPWHPPSFDPVLHAHPVRGESHNQHNTTGEVATVCRPNVFALNLSIKCESLLAHLAYAFAQFSEEPE